ncbi:nuclear pore complex protein Nup160-like [Liolophura sinensis]|uniref:nuclear pore complex protein Nup160-like n=1 Tax=Liolophura sinensis TaxID=3198878 RepID=UPI0031583076
MSCRCFREVTVTPSVSPRWRDINANTGGSVSTLQDIKVPDTSGGYAYRDSSCAGSPTRNRFLYWRTSNDVLELVEESLDLNLSLNHVRCRFQDTPILGGITVHEQHGNVVLLLVTVASVHRLIFPHPSKLQRFDQGLGMSSDVSMNSILADASVSTVCNPKDSHMLGSVTGSSQLSHAAATWLTSEGEALFVYVSHTGSIVVIKMPPHNIQGVVIQYELTRSTMMQRFWTGLVPASIRGDQDSPDTPYSLCLHPLGQDIHIFSICRDHKIRMWSTKNQECVSVCDMLEWTTYSHQSQKASVSGTGHQIKKLVDHETGTFRLAIYLGFKEQPMFCLLEPHIKDGRYHLDHVCSISAPSEDLIDYHVTPSLLWSLWTDTEGEMIARVASLHSEPARGDNWMPVLLDPPATADILIPAHKDPREVYMDLIFQPGQFSTQDIQKALNIYRRTLDSTVTDHHIGIPTLKEEVSAAVETEIQTVAGEYELPEEEYYQLQLEQWAKFYSCCIQYHEVGTKSKGIFADSNTGMVGIIRKGGLTYIRPCDPVEQVSLVPTEQISPTYLADMQIFGEDIVLCEDIIHLLECLNLIGHHLSDDLAATFDQELYQLRPPDMIAHQLLDEILSLPIQQDNTELSKQLEYHLQCIKKLHNTLHTFQILLDLTRGQGEDFGIEDSSLDATSQLTCGHLFASSLATGVLSVYLRQMTETRLSVARDLLLLQLFILRLKEKAGFSPETAESVQSDSIPKTCILIRSYFILQWLTHTVISPTAPNSLEFNMRQLAALDINDTAGVTVIQQSGHQNMTLADLFIQGIGGSNARILLAQNSFLDEDPCRTWSQTLQPLVTILAQLLWPYSINFLFPEFLMGQCQYLHLQEYIRLLAGWCEWNEASRKFLLGQCYLNFNEPYKAVDSFIDGEKGVAGDEFLLSKLLQTDETDIHKLEVLYYLKVIKLYEQFCIPDLIVTLADTAISKADDDDPNLPTLWSKVFKYQLEMSHNDEAYSAMVSNPDCSRRTDCLRQFLVVLIDRGELQTLVQYQYIDLHDEVVSILESRARSVDLATHNYYDLLYSFHIYRGNYRKAGSVMYEYGRRLGQELPNLKGLQRQAKCYLAALNALRLVDPKYAWIVKPLPQPRLQDSRDLPDTSPKHTWDGEEKPNFSQKIELLELADIDKEYLLVNARLRLIQKDPDPSHVTGPTSGPVEMVGLLVNNGLYDQAVVVSKTFELPLAPVMEGLAMRCLQLAQNSNYHMQGDNDYTAQAWDWLAENETEMCYSTKEASSSADQAWRLLQFYLEQYDDANGQFHRTVAVKLLSHGFSLPSWFMASYKTRNAAELLRLLIDYDLLEQAGSLALEYIEAMRDVTRGQDREVFNLKGLLTPLPQSVWLPYTCIDQLLAALKDGQADQIYRKMSEQLQSKMTRYQLHVDSLAENLDTLMT